MTKYEGEEKRAPTGLEKHVAIIIQSVVLMMLVWLVNSTLDLTKTVIRLEERLATAQAASSRVEADVAAIRNQLQTMSTAIQSGVFKTENLDQRVKGLETRVRP